MDCILEVFMWERRKVDREKLMETTVVRILAAMAVANDDVSQNMIGLHSVIAVAECMHA
jgi:hypothetical protein